MKTAGFEPAGVAGFRIFQLDLFELFPPDILRISVR